MGNLDRWYPESRFGGYTDIDGTVAFYTRIQSLVNDSSVVLDVGCGRGAHIDDPVPLRRELRTFKGRCARVVGIDVDSAGETNPFIDEFVKMDLGGGFPVADEGADVLVSDSVLEHISDPDAFFTECARVLRPGGYLCLRTPNVWSYVGILSRMIPDRFHARVLERVQTGRQEDDVFPTVYRCNTRRKIARAMERSGFDHVVYTYEAEPSYLSFSRFFYALGVLHQRYAPRAVRLAIFAFGQKI